MLVSTIKLLQCVFVPGFAEELQNRINSESSRVERRAIDDIRFARNAIYVGVATTAVAAVGVTSVIGPAKCVPIGLTGIGINTTVFFTWKICKNILKLDSRAHIQEV